MSLFEQHREIMDAQVDKHLGDSIQYKRDGSFVEHEGSTTLNAFLSFIGDDGGYDGVTPQQSRWRLKIRKALLPDGVVKARDVITSAKLAGAYRPGANTPADDGEYWLVDLQKAPA